MRLERPLDEVLRDRSHVRVLRALEALPRGLPASAREIARRAGISHPTAAKVLASLAAQGIAVVQRAPRADAYRLNEDHVLTERLRPLFEWERRLRGDLGTLLLRQIEERAPWVEDVYVFGSAARGETTSTSDIDLAVTAPGRREDEVERALEPVVQVVRRRFGNDLNIVIGTARLDRLRRRGHGKKLWERIARDGVRLTVSA